MAKYNRKFVQCKGPIKHAWFHYNPPREEIQASVLACWKRILLRCERCMATRHDGIDENGDLIARRYKYPDGYKETGRTPDGRMSQNELRLIVVKWRNK